MRTFSKPRLLVVTTSYPLDLQSASAYHIKSYLSGLESDFDIVIITPDSGRRPYGAEFSRPDDPGRVVRFRYAPAKLQVLANRPGGLPAALAGRSWKIMLAPLFWGAMVLSLARHMPRADVVHANWSLSGLAASLVGLILKVPVITTLRGSDVNWAARSFWGKMVLAGCARWCHCLVTVSPALEKQVASLLAKRWRPIRLISIENGVDRELWAIDPLAPTPCCSELRILVVSNLIPAKRVDLAITALARLGNGFNASLEIIGLGPELENLRSLARKLGVSQQVVFRGTVDHGQVVASLAACQILIHPSLAEGRSNVVLEAMAAGRAVIASRIPGIEDLINDGVSGLLFEAGNGKQLAGHLCLLAADSDLRARLGGAARRTVKATISGWDHTSMRYGRLFNQAMALRAGEN